MPVFIPVAGPSPSCWAVLVQMEHCAIISGPVSRSRQINKLKMKFFFMVKLKVKSTTKEHTEGFIGINKLTNSQEGGKECPLRGHLFGHEITLKATKKCKIQATDCTDKHGLDPESLMSYT